MIERGSKVPRAAVVVDTNVLGAGLVPGRPDLWAAAKRSLDDVGLMISFVTAAELRFGARRAGWGRVRLSALEGRLTSVVIVWPGPRLLARYVDLRDGLARSGHVLADKIHEADRWIAATALDLSVPLVTNDRIFLDVPALDVHLVTSAGA